MKIILVEKTFLNMEFFPAIIFNSINNLITGTYEPYGTLQIIT